MTTFIPRQAVRKLRAKEIAYQMATRQGPTPMPPPAIRLQHDEVEGTWVLASGLLGDGKPSRFIIL